MSTKVMPAVRIHAGGTCAEQPCVEIEGYVCEVRHVENMGVGAPVSLELCGCAMPISDREIKRISDLAIDAVAPAHVRRQRAVANGAEIVTEVEACEKLKIGHTKLWELIGEGVLPEPLKRGRNNIWLLSELQWRYASTLTGPTGENRKAPLNRHERRKLAARKA